MAKMTVKLIEKLYYLGKKTYANELNIQDAVNVIMNSYGTDIAKSSAEFYIGLFRDLITGKGSTWNQNSDLLVYYVDHIASEYGKEIGSKAFQGGMKFAQAKSRKPLIDALNELKDKHGLSDDEIVDSMVVQKQKFIDWMKNQRQSNGFGYKEATIYRYAKALEKYAAQIEGLIIESNNLFYYDRKKRNRF